ncbi:response regulator [Fuchsiella alkaliacetigena]|uniref:response regulator n=1 Tax=Fuchsiella alkaliacetigena TaxID=957042 RepID=UPI00200A01BB|nr:response regulator [Fuchsiella alkaliacetigena]MCK8823970.1 response regulator [Fuchsiella alkaliacetigena]
MSKRVLITDDAQFMRTMLKQLVEEQGYEVVAEAEDGKKAIELYKEHSPDLVTMDITMPEMDGIEATKEILDFDPNAIIVMCSAMGQKPMVVDALEAGAKDFIVKPIQAEKVKETLDSIFNG